MGIKDVITQDESNWYSNKFSPLLLLKTYRDKQMRIWILILGFEGLITAFNPLRKGLVLRENNKKSQGLFS